MITVSEIIKELKAKSYEDPINGVFITTHNCEVCCTPVGYVIQSGVVYYESVCDCSSNAELSYGVCSEERDISDIIQFISINKDNARLKKDLSAILGKEITEIVE